MRKLVLSAAVAAALMVAGCKKDIYHGLTELEANEIVVALADHGIECEKEADTGGHDNKKGPAFKIAVEEERAVEAQRTLLDLHLPRIKQQGINEVFASPSMIPTETEEHARRLMANQGTIANTLQQVDGVVDAKVQLVFPEANPLENNKDLTEARAAVLIKHYAKATQPKEAELIKTEHDAYHAMLVALGQDLRTLKVLLGREIAGLKKQEDEERKLLDTYFSDSKRGEDTETKRAREAFRRLDEAAIKRDGYLAQLQALPKVKDLDKVLAKVQDLELEALPFSSASVRALVAHSVPRLSEDDVCVEFTKVQPKTIGTKYEAPSGPKWLRKEVVLGLAATLVVVTGGAIIFLVLMQGLKKQLQQARAAAAKAASASYSGSMAPAAPPAPGAPQ